MTQDLLAIRAIDLGCVRTSIKTWRCLGFDLTAIEGEVTSGWIWINTVRLHGESVTFADAADCEPFISATLTASGHDSRVRVPLNDSAIRTLNLASRGFLFLDAWSSNESDGAFEAYDIVLELEAVHRPVQKAA
jgi:hypothetical protein